MNVNTVQKKKPHPSPRKRDAIVRDLGLELNALIGASRAVMAEAAASFQPPVSGAAFQVLHWLHSFGPARAGRIADTLAMDRSVVSRLMGQLGEVGLIKAARSPEDGRSIVYDLTDTGRTGVSEALGRKGNRFEVLLQQWDEADLKRLTSLLRRLNGRA